MKNPKPTETETTENVSTTENVNDVYGIDVSVYPTVVTTTEITDVIIRSGIDESVTTKKLRSVLRTVVTDGTYTKYRFNRSDIKSVVDLYRNVVSDRRNRRIVSDRIKSVESVPVSIIKIDTTTGTYTTVKPEPKPEPETKPTE